MVGIGGDNAETATVCTDFGDNTPRLVVRSNHIQKREMSMAIWGFFMHEESWRNYQTYVVGVNFELSSEKIVLIPCREVSLRHQNGLAAQRLEAFI